MPRYFRVVYHQKWTRTLKAVQKRLLAVMQQGKVIARMRLLIGLYRLRELSHNRVKGMLLVEPMGKHMHADT